jgi:hypothetical protein
MKNQDLKYFCKKNPELAQTHMYIIIPGSGKTTGVPQWECIYCNHKVIAS